MITLVLQARTSSVRLPAKSLLPIGGMPLAVLVAKRASNTGLDLIVATSEEPSDDALAQALEDHGLNVFRGPLNNCLKRFIDALAEKADSELIVRLTGDNPVPDGNLITEVIQEYEARGLNYIRSERPIDSKTGLPIGLSLEVFRLGDLRAVQVGETTEREREHVTIKIIKKFGNTHLAKYENITFANVKYGIDSLEDYERVCNIFKDVDDPVNAPWKSLIEHG